MDKSCKMLILFTEWGGLYDIWYENNYFIAQKKITLGESRSKIISILHARSGDQFVYIRPANEKRRYDVTSSLIGRAHTHKDLCV